MIVKNEDLEESKQRTTHPYAIGCLGGLIVWLIAFFVAFIYLFFQDINADTVGLLGLFVIFSLIVAFPAGFIGWGVVTWWLLRKEEAEEDSS